MRVITCRGTWSLRDNTNDAGQIHVYLIDLAHLPTSEQHYWKAFDAAWATSENRLHLAPGEEILTEVFSKLGSDYRKPKDTVRVAKEMHSEEIPEEIKGLLEKVYKLPPY